MSLFIHVLADIIHLIKIIVLCDLFFSFRRRKIEQNRVLLLLVGFTMGGISVFIYRCNNHIIETFIYVVAIVLMLYLLYKEKFCSLVIVVVWMLLALSMIDTMFSVLYRILMNLLEIDGEIVANLFVSLISLSLIYIVGSVYKKNAVSGMNSIGIANLFWFTLLLLADTLVVTIVEFVNADLKLEKYRRIYLVAIVLVIIGIFIQLVAVILLIIQRNSYKEKKQITEKYLNEQKNHYEYLENREIETKKFRHDLRSHMKLISSMARNHEYEKIEDYLEKMHMKIDTFGNIVTVQNGIVDAIINQYYAKAKQSGVTMEVRGRFPEDCAIDAYDVCTIFSNILSNALEAAIETEEKFVSVECRYNDRNIIILVKNSFRSEQQNANTLLKTRKDNLDYHGYGLENMKDSVCKYNGVFDIETKDNIFILTIVFNNIGK